MMKPEILTHSGRVFNLADPKPEQVHVPDIAHALSKLCRFTGHTDKFYSVAQHSVLVSMEVPAQYALLALFHDAHEAYTGDMNGPLKSLLAEYTDAYQHIVRPIDCAIFKVLPVDADATSHLSKAYPIKSTHEAWDYIHQADMRVLMSEKRDLMPATGSPWVIDDGHMVFSESDPLSTIADTIIPGGHQWSYWAFMHRYYSLVGDHEAAVGAHHQILSLATSLRGRNPPIATVDHLG